MEKSNNTIRCIVIDDEPNAIEVIVHHMQSFEDYTIDAMFTDAFEARQYMKNNLVDIIFLDIQMPGINGLDFLRSLREKPAIFLTTAYRHYAPEAFELEVMDYLLKPISITRLSKALRKFEIARQKLKMMTDPDEEAIIVRSNRMNVKVMLKDLLFLEAKGDYVKLHLKSSESHLRSSEILTKDTLKSLISKLPSSRFKQVHRSFVINLSAIQSESAHFIQIAGLQIPKGRYYK